MKTTILCDLCGSDVSSPPHVEILRPGALPAKHLCAGCLKSPVSLPCAVPADGAITRTPSLGTVLARVGALVIS